MIPKTACPLCGCPGGSCFETVQDSKHYARCVACGFIWMLPKSRLKADAERAHYSQHENDPADDRYRNFLKRLWLPLKAKLVDGAVGMDYGSGPGPTLHLMAEEDGFRCVDYDPFFNRDESVLDQNYDFITCSETAEHFYDPAAEFARLAELLKTGGWLGVMTSRYTEAIDFDHWHYRHDPTHVAFYTERTFEVLAKRFAFSPPEFISSSVVLLQKQPVRPYL